MVDKFPSAASIRCLFVRKRQQSWLVWLRDLQIKFPISVYQALAAEIVMTNF
jgi:hypothetical protein